VVVLTCLLISCAPRTQFLATETSVQIPNETLTPTKNSLNITPISTNAEKNSNQFPVLTSTNPPTPSPFPTLTPYPTFEIKDVKTHTPFPPAQCPPSDPNHKLSPEISAEITSSSNFGPIAQKALEEGASFDQVMKTFNQIPLSQRADELSLMDVTGDGVPELVIEQVFNLVVIGCNNGRYTTILDFNPTHNWPPSLVTAQDMNLNGIPDMVLTYDVTSGSNTVVDILEWNGAEFRSMIQANHGKDSASTSRFAKALYWYSQQSDNWSADPDINVPTMNGGAKIVIRDMDGNGTKELILTDNGPQHPDTLYTFGPWRGQQVVFKWDGIHYLYSLLELKPPVYRFQAIQDADRFFFMGEYDKALAAYQNVIFSNSLEWWSEEKMMMLRLLQDVAHPTLPAPDTNEYLKLVAYAKYRILLYHLAVGQNNEASITYKTLLEKNPTGSAGYPYSAMATLLWNEYQKTQSLEASCLPVIEYVKFHSGVLDALGNRLHGLQSHEYTPNDICPFK
jgi:hypothetical protein